MKLKRYTLKLDEYEHGAILRALVELRNKYISENQSVEFLNEVILKLCREK